MVVDGRGEDDITVIYSGECVAVAAAASEAAEEEVETRRG